MNYGDIENIPDYRTPFDELCEKEEPDYDVNPYREAALAFTRILTLALSYILEQQDCRTAAYGVAFALGVTSVTQGKSMRELGRELNLSHGTISVHAKKFRLMAGLPPSLSQQELSKADKSRESRNRNLL